MLTTFMSHSIHNHLITKFGIGSHQQTQYSKYVQIKGTEHQYRHQLNANKH